jgi:hypothetical protein
MNNLKPPSWKGNNKAVSMYTYDAAWKLVKFTKVREGK